MRKGADAKQLRMLMKQATGDAPKMGSRPSSASAATTMSTLAGAKARHRWSVSNLARRRLLSTFTPNFRMSLPNSRNSANIRPEKAVSYINELADVDQNVLERIVAGWAAEMRKKHRPN